MIAQSVHFVFAEADVEKAAAMLQELRDASRRESGVITFNVVRGSEAPAFALYEEYRDETAFEAHKASAHYERLVVQGLRTIALRRDGVIGAPL